MHFPVFCLLTVFAFQILEIPPPPAKTNPKTCCGRTVCLCTHPKGKPCDFKRQKEEALKRLEKTALGRHCHLHRSEPDEKQERAGIQGLDTDRLPVPFLSKAPCRKDAPKTALPGVVPLL